MRIEINNSSSPIKSNLEEMNEIDYNPGYENNIVLFWLYTTFFVLIGLITTAGNALVLYAAHGHKNRGPLRYLDSTIKSLALTDMLFGLIGTPLIMFAYYTGNDITFVQIF